MLQPGTERNYDCARGLWEVYAKRKGCAQLDNFKTPKGYICMIAHAIDGRYGDPKACLTMVLQYWKNTTASLSQTGHPVRSNIVLSTTNFINGPLQRKMSLAHQKCVRKFGTMIHFIYLSTQLWKYDWHRYDSPKDCLDLWDGIMLNVFTSAQVSKYIKSTAHEGSGRGLCYKDVEFVIFHNEHRQPEFAMEVKKDGKGMTATPWRNPEHSLHEGSGQHPLMCNPLLTRVAILLAKGAFHNYQTMDKLLNVVLPEEGIVRIHWH
ncbi:hypothetical protein FRB94_003096 [Tulasnella sp. JGI-2019a]|nr:hypothetical protein FRB94_003096 [Tulasnella sp. JGI-2019a]